MTDLFSLDDVVETERTSNFHLADSDVFSRLVYMLKTMKVTLPSWLKYKIQFINDIEKPLVLFSPLMKSAYNKGAVYGEPNIDEFKQILHKVVVGELKGYDDHKKFFDFSNALSDGLFTENHEVWLEDIEDGKHIEKFNSGFAPFDKATGGFYESIVTVAGEPGSGKTSVLLKFLGALSQHYECWYFQTEIPADLIKSRISLVKPSNIHPGCKVFCGNYNSEDILKRIKEQPNPNRIIIYDSPEINNAEDEVAYFKKCYQDLVAIKMLSKMVVVTSQIKQNITWDQLGIYSLSASASKARYTDIILYVGRILDTLLVKTAKNRFGSLGAANVSFDYETLQIRQDFVDKMFED
jgi:hypothetical protein